MALLVENPDTSLWAQFWDCLPQLLTTWLVEDRNWLVLTDALKEVTIESMTLSNRWATSFSRSYRSATLDVTTFSCRKLWT